MEESLLRWVESNLQLPIWLPVLEVVYDQLNQAVASAVDSFNSADRRESALPLVTSQTDALCRLCALLKYSGVPSYVEEDCRKYMPQVVGEETVAAYWERLTPAMRRWIAKVVYLLPITPWGERRTSATVTMPTEGDAPIQLQMVMLELLTKARLLYHLFEDSDGPRPREPAGGERVIGPQLQTFTNSVFPYMPERPESCPYPPKHSLDPSDPATYSALLLLLAPASPETVAKSFPQLILLNGEGIGGETRSKCANRIALRLLLSRLPAANPRWTLLPATYSPELALAALGKLGGPQHVMLRHPHGDKYRLHGGGEVALTADELDDALRVLLLPSDDPRRAEVNPRVASIVKFACARRPRSRDDRATGLTAPAALCTRIVPQMVNGLTECC